MDRIKMMLSSSNLPESDLKFFENLQKKALHVDLELLTESEAKSKGITFASVEKNNKSAAAERIQIILPDCAPVLLNTVEYGLTDVGCGKLLGAVMGKYITTAMLDGKIVPYVFSDNQYGGGAWLPDEDLDYVGKVIAVIVDDMNRCQQLSTETFTKKKTYSALGTLHEKKINERHNMICDINVTMINRMKRFGNGSPKPILNAMRASYINHGIEINGPETLTKLNLLNGVYDLVSDRFNPGPHPELGFGFILPTLYDPTVGTEGEAQVFLQNICRKNGKRRETVEKYLIQLLGSCLDRSRVLKKILILLGKTANNGKTTFLEFLTSVLGDVDDHGVAGAVNPKEFNQYENSSSLTPMLCAAKDAILLKVSETEVNQYMSCEKLKAISGGGAFQLNPKFGKCYSWTFKSLLCIDCNSFPTFTDSSIFESNRIAVVDFEWQPTKIDVGYKDKICSSMTERSVMFNLLLAGYRSFKANNFSYDVPDELEKLLSNYARNNNIYRRFLTQKCEVTSNDRDCISLYQLVTCFRSFVSDEEEYGGSLNNVKTKLHTELQAMSGCRIEQDAHGTLTVYGLRVKNYTTQDTYAQPCADVVTVSDMPVLDGFTRIYFKPNPGGVVRLVDVKEALDRYCESINAFSEIYNLPFLSGDEDLHLLEHVAQFYSTEGATIGTSDDGGDVIKGLELLDDEEASKNFAIVRERAVGELILDLKRLDKYGTVLTRILDLFSEDEIFKDKLNQTLDTYISQRWEVFGVNSSIYN
jgi:hypothetical protein